MGTKKLRKEDGKNGGGKKLAFNPCFSQKKSWEERDLFPSWSAVNFQAYDDVFIIRLNSFDSYPIRLKPAKGYEMKTRGVILLLPDSSCVCHPLQPLLGPTSSSSSTTSSSSSLSLSFSLFDLIKPSRLLWCSRIDQDRSHKVHTLCLSVCLSMSDWRAFRLFCHCLLVIVSLSWSDREFRTRCCRSRLYQPWQWPERVQTGPHAPWWYNSVFQVIYND